MNPTSRIYMDTFDPISNRNISIYHAIRMYYMAFTKVVSVRSYAHTVSRTHGLSRTPALYLPPPPPQNRYLDESAQPRLLGERECCYVETGIMYRTPVIIGKISYQRNSPPKTLMLLSNRTHGLISYWTTCGVLRKTPTNITNFRFHI
jgi:hypothetical protein